MKENETERSHRVNLERICPHCQKLIVISCLKVDTFNNMNRPIKYRFEFISGTKCKKCGKILPYDILDNIHHPVKSVY